SSTYTVHSMCSFSSSHSYTFFNRTFASSALIKSAISAKRVTPENCFANGDSCFAKNQAGGGGRPRIFRRFLSESKSSTATERDFRESEAQSEIISVMASLADSRSSTKRNPLFCGRYFDP